MAQLIREDFDFSGYMEDSDAAHRLRSAGEYAEEVVRLFQGLNQAKGETLLPWPKAKGQFRFRPGEVTLWTGWNGSGKSLLIGQVFLYFIVQAKRCCIASMEMTPASTLQRMCRQRYGRDPSVEQINRFHAETDNWLWLYDQLGQVRSQKMLAVARYCADRLNVQHLVIDSLMKCGMGEDDFNAQKHFVDALCALARDSGMHIHLVAHARKGADENKPPNKLDVKGTGTLTDMVDNCLAVWWNKPKTRAIEEGQPHDHKAPDALLICDKQRHGEWEGKIALWFDPQSQKYLENGL